MKIEDYFRFYKNIKEVKGFKFKRFTFLDKQISLIRYLKQNKKDIIKYINYAFFESNEPYLISVFNESDIHYIHINERLCKEKLSKNFDSVYEYENYLAIYGTFAVLIGENFQAQDLNDSRISFRDFLHELTFHIYYDDAFRLNLESFVGKENEILRYVYRYGYDFLLESFKFFYKDVHNSFNYNQIIRFLSITDDEFRELFALYKSKIILESEL